jgi:glycosyltransferase involved in cell wall biosynthesis
MSVSIQKPTGISAIVPARNEQAVIAACLESLAAQDEIDEILVIDDQSTDQTVAIVRTLIERYPRLRLLETKELPTGWVGKNYALSLGAKEAKGEWLLFTDADALHSSDSAAKALAIAKAENAAMISFSPEQVMERWYEKALIPYVYCRLARRFSYQEVNDRGKSVAAANGQFLLFRGDVYTAVGGHRGVAQEVLEDVALAQRVKGAGYPIWFGSGKSIVRVRMYRSFGAMWEGWKKNLYPLMGNRPARAGAEIAIATGPIFAILIAMISASLWMRWPPIALGVAIAGAVGLAGLYAQELRRNGFARGLALYGLPGRLLFAGVLFASYQCYRRRKLEWKGREYPVDTPRASKGMAK